MMAQETAPTVSPWAFGLTPCTQDGSLARSVTSSLAVRKTDALPNLFSWFRLLSVSGCNLSPTLVKLTSGTVLSNCLPISAGNKTSFLSSATIGAMEN